MSRSSQFLNGFLRLRRSPVLARVYRLLPLSIRTRIRNFAWRTLKVKVGFPKLPSEPHSRDFRPHHDGSDMREINQGDGTRLNVYGFMGGQFGLGECARLYVRALDACGFSVAARDVNLSLPHAWVPFEHPAMGRPLFVDGYDVVVINPDFIRNALLQVRSSGEATRPLIGVWFWELSTLPEQWIPALELVDAIVVASRFVEETFKNRTSKPVLRVPVPLVDLPDSGASRGDFGLPKGAFLFLTSFDFHSSIHRKNPHAVIAAFREAFPRSRSDVALVVKSVNGCHYPEALAALHESANGDPRVLVRDEVLSAQHLGALQRCCDAYVSLHRAEGFGLGLAECMARQKAVVATGWSGNLDFMNNDVACLVDFELVPVERTQYPRADGSMWAEPDVIQSAEYMRALADDPAASRELGQRASRHVRRLLSPERMAESFAHALARMPELRAGRQPI